MAENANGGNTPTATKKEWSKKQKVVLWSSIAAVLVLVGLLIWQPWSGKEASASLTETDTTTVGTTKAKPLPVDTTKANTTTANGGSGGGQGGNAGGSSAGNAATSSTALTVADTVNVRNSPAKSGAIVQQLTAGDTIVPIGISADGKWLDTGSGWVYRSLVKGDTVTTKSTKTYTRNAMLKPSKNAKDKGGVITVHSSGGW